MHLIKQKVIVTVILSEHNINGSTFLKMELRQFISKSGGVFELKQLQSRQLESKVSLYYG